MQPAISETILNMFTLYFAALQSTNAVHQEKEADWDGALGYVRAQMLN